jgi:hypothetical protein
LAQIFNVIKEKNQMAYRVWIPAFAAVALLLSACGDSQEDPAVNPDDNSAVVNEETPRGEGVSEEEDAPAANEDTAEMSNPEEVEDDIEARQAAEELEPAEALREDGDIQRSDNAAGVEGMETGEDNLATDPGDVLDEERAMPGEATRSDVDEIIAETERRFEEAEQRLEEQFREVERQTPTVEPMENEDFSSSWDTESSLPERTPLQDDREATDVDALIEDTERRFEEAQQRLEEQFQELESQEAATGPAIEPGNLDSRDVDSSDVDSSDVDSSDGSQETGASDEG